IDVSAAAILREAVEIYERARDLGLSVPTHVSVKFRNKIATPQYRDIVATSELDPVVLGYLLGNKHRWDQGLCKFFTLHFLKFFMTRTPKSRFDPRKLTLQYEIPSANSEETLFVYDGSKYADRYVDFGPTLFLGNNRYITIKIKTMYPNVSKGTGEYMLRWINMRYTKTSSGNVTLERVPDFKAKRKDVGKSLETRGQIRNQPGQIANFSYCLLANAFKEICQTSLDMLAGINAGADTNPERVIPFDLLNLIEKRNSKFRIVTYRSRLGPLFEGTEGVEVGEEYRINGESEISFLFGTREDIREIAEQGSVTSAYAAETFHLSHHNLYADIEDDSPVFGILFKTDRQGDLETSGMVFWDDPADIETYEILDEDQIIQTFGA
ncbi:MAG: hypothetical protein ACO39X_07290, partial [Candidatus Nanopelagicaceae bacterium]